jgi:antitoxin MazE
VKTRVRKWGNSLALRIPKSVATEVGLREGLAVDIAVIGGKLVVQPDTVESLRLDDLLRGVTAENLHHEWNAGRAAGKELW